MEADQAKLGAINEYDSLMKQCTSGGGWLYAIAALSLVNTVLFLAGTNTHFVIGSAITELVDAIAAEAGKVGTAFAVIFDIAAAGIMFALGFMARKPRMWAFAVGLALYAIDTLLVVVFSVLAWRSGESGDWFSVVFHFLALFYIFAGLQAAAKLKRMPIPSADGEPLAVEASK